MFGLISKTKYQNGTVFKRSVKITRVKNERTQYCIVAQISSSFLQRMIADWNLIPQLTERLYRIPIRIKMTANPRGESKNNDDTAVDDTSAFVF
jgi:hypothetical protein